MTLLSKLMKNIKKIIKSEVNETSNAEKKKNWNIRRTAAALRRKSAAKRRQDAKMQKTNKIKKPEKIINHIKSIKKSKIIEQINLCVMSEGHKDYQSWEIGTTNKPILRKKQYSQNGENVQFWKQWRTENSQDAKNIKKHFKPT